jgi:hypothetical protein
MFKKSIEKISVMRSVPRSALISELDYRVKIGAQIFLKKQYLLSLMKTLAFRYNENECELIWRKGLVDGWFACRHILYNNGVTIQQLLEWVEKEFGVDVIDIRKYHDLK